MTVNLKNFNLLIVEDDKGVLDSLCDFFTSEGINVFSSSSGRKALQIALTEKIDIILTDVRMPVMDGIELLKVVKAYSDNVPLIWLMSAHTDLSEKSVLALGAEGILQKPFPLDLALEKIRQSIIKKEITQNE